MRSIAVPTRASAARPAAAASIALSLLAGLPAAAQALAPVAVTAQAPEEFPPFEKAIEGLDKVISTADGADPLYDLYRDRKTGKLLAVLPAGYQSQLLMIACTVTGGDPEAGVMGPTHYAKWERINKQLVLVAPNFNIRTNGDPQAKASQAALYTGRVIRSTPILALAPGDRPVIDLAAIGLQQAPKLFGGDIWGGYGPSLGA